VSQRKISTIELDYEQLTLFPGDSLASHFPWLESKKVKKMTVTYGRKCSGLSEKLSRLGYLVRTYLESCELPGKQFVRTWSVRDTLSPYLILKLRLSERRIEGTECSLWRTPDAHCDRGASSKERMQMKIEKGLPISLNDQIAHPKLMWPTPDAQNHRDGTKLRKEAKGRHAMSLHHAVKMWPTPMYATPQARDFRTGQTKRWEDPNRSRNLNDQIGGQLNPTWVEWLQGFPVGWTDIGE